MIVKNLVSNNGNPVPNQFDISINGARYMQSYSTICVVIVGKAVTLSDDWDCSRTTMRYVCQFLRVNSVAAIRKRIADGTYKVVPTITIK